MKVEWQDYLCTGMLEIDIQHKLLFDKFNAFLEAYEANRGDEEVSKLFWFLEAYAMTHFKEEERLMERLAHPDLPMHRNQHKSFIATIGEYKERLKNEGANLNLIGTVTRFVSSWLIDHISRVDRRIAHLEGH